VTKFVLGKAGPLGKRDQVTTAKLAVNCFEDAY